MRKDKYLECILKTEQQLDVYIKLGDPCPIYVFTGIWQLIN